MPTDPSSFPEAWISLSTATGTRGMRVDKSRLTIGAATSADLCVQGSNVSGMHAEIIRTGGCFVLSDRSRFGTYVNGTKITTHQLNHGDRIRLGPPGAVELTFSFGAPTESSLNPTITEARRMGSILRVLDAIGSGTVLEDVLALVVDSALRNTSAERGFVMLADSTGELEIRTARADGGLDLLGTSFVTSRRIPREVFATGRTQIVPDLKEEPTAALHDHSVAAGIRHVVCVPIKVSPPVAASAPGSHVIGVLYLDSEHKQQMLSERTITALEAFATQAGIAIDTGRLYAAAAEKAVIERELAMAASIQRALLPAPLRQTDFFEIAAACTPARTVGGDFYDYVDIDARRFGFTVGDVAGKGPPAALLAAAVQSYLAALAPVCEDAAEVMSRVNQALRRRVVEARFATMFYGVLTPDGMLRYSNAGQEPPLLMRADGVSALSEGGPPLGLFEGASYLSGTAHLRAGDLLVVYSDGITEARSQSGGWFGREGLLAVLLSCRGMSAAEALAAILDAVSTFADRTSQADDITALVMRFNGSGVATD